jgi:hypothetical protein
MTNLQERLFRPVKIVLSFFPKDAGIIGLALLTLENLLWPKVLGPEKIL